MIQFRIDWFYLFAIQEILNSLLQHHNSKASILQHCLLYGLTLTTIQIVNAGDGVSIPGLGRSPKEGNGNPLQLSCLGNPMERGAWQATVHGVTKSRTRLTLFIELNAIIYIYSCSHFYGFKKKSLWNVFMIMIT